MSDARSNEKPSHQQWALEMAERVSSNDSEDGRMALEARTRKPVRSFEKGTHTQAATDLKSNISTQKKF
jgi:hypothetical protein